MAKKILFVAMQMSIHTSRWINQILDQEWEVHLFPIDSNPMHCDLKNIVIHQPFIPITPLRQTPKLLANKRSKFFHKLYSIKWLLINMINPMVRAAYPLPALSRIVNFFGGFQPILLGESEINSPTIYGPATLVRVIKKLKPDLIHSLEFQHCGYLVLRAKELFGLDFPPWMATNWGSDIFFYQQFDTHRSQITRLLKNINYYSCECHRDYALAVKLGFTGRLMGVAPNTGGFDLEKIKTMRGIQQTSERKLVLVKGYQSFAGRALTALDAIEENIEALVNFKVIVYSASVEIFERIATLKKLGVDISTYSHTSHHDMLILFSRARIYLGISVSDGISTSLLEAMALGTFPIQTNTSCCNEWIEDGKTGFEIPHDNLSIISHKLYRALKEDELVNDASNLNWDIICARMDLNTHKQNAISMYRELV